MTKSAEAIAVQRPALDLAYENINRTNESVQKQLRIMIGAGLAFITIIGGLGAFLVANSFGDLKRELRDMVSLEVGRIVTGEEGEGAHLKRQVENLNKNFQKLKEESIKVEQDLRNLREFEKLTSNLGDDLSYAYNQADSIASDPASHLDLDKRRVAQSAFRLLIDNGLSLSIEPNSLYNASANASILGFNLEALQLAALAFEAFPNPAYEARWLRHQHLMGRSFEVREGRLVALNVPAEEVRDTAWQAMLALVRDSGSNDAELVLSEAWNISVRRGAQRDLIHALSELESRRRESNEHFPSYGHATMARLAHIDGAPSLTEFKLAQAEKALCALSIESSAASWRKSTLDELKAIRDDDPMIAERLDGIDFSAC